MQRSQSLLKQGTRRREEVKIALYAVISTLGDAGLISVQNHCRERQQAGTQYEMV